MKKLILTILTIFAVTTFSLSAKDIKKIEFSVIPAMHCEKCETKIKNRLKFEKGIKRIDANSKRGTVIVEFDADKINTEKISQSLQKIGYTPRFTPEKKAE